MSNDFPAPRYPAGYTAAEIAVMLGVSRTTAIAMFHGLDGVIDLGARLEPPKTRARKVMLRVPSEIFLRFVRCMTRTATKDKLITSAERKQAANYRRDHIRDTSGLARKRLTAMKQGGIEAARATAA